MSVEIIRNTAEAEGPAQPILREDGTWYPLCMTYDGGKYLAFADTPDDLLNILIPGYANLSDEDDQMAARIRLALDVQVSTQAEINASVNQETWDALTDWEAEILQGDRSRQPHGWGRDDRGDVWSSDVPLVLVESGYAPYSEIDQPMSEHGQFEDGTFNLYWIKPVWEYEFLVSLSTIGYIDLAVADAVADGQG